MIGKFKIETPKKIWIDEFICLVSKMYAFKSGNDSKNELKRICKTQSKNIKFEEYHNCLFGGDYEKECESDITKSRNLEMYLQKLCKNSLSPFDEKRCYIKNIESKPWKYYY